MAESVPTQRINILVLTSSKSLNRSTDAQTITHTRQTHSAFLLQSELLDTSSLSSERLIRRS